MTSPEDGRRGGGDYDIGRMTARLLPVVVLLSTLAFAQAPAPGHTAAAPASEPATAQALKQLEQNWVDAIARHDTAALNLILAPDFRETAYNGSVRTRDEVLANAANRQRHVTNHLEDVQVRVYSGQFAVVNGVNNAETPVGTARLRFSDVFVYRQGRWQAVQAQETVVSPHPPMPATSPH